MADISMGGWIVRTFGNELFPASVGMMARAFAIAVTSVRAIVVDAIESRE